ncbi:MAG: DinB family protein [Acidobacteriota bacterium]
MSYQAIAQKRLDERELSVRWQLEVWNDQNSRLSELLYELTDDDLQKEVAPGRGTGSYILGRLAAVNDGMIPLLGLGKKTFPILDEVFPAAKPNAKEVGASVAEIRRVWADLLGVLRENFARLTTGDWFQKHAAITDEEFADEPHQNRLRVLIDKTNNLSFELGQLASLKNAVGN